MIILVCGGAGYIGSHMCKRLAREGHQPITFDNLSTGHAWGGKWVLCCAPTYSTPRHWSRSSAIIESTL